MNVLSRAAPSSHVAQGEFKIAAGADAMLTTILGSCVAACLWDHTTGIGGMNHIVLPDAPDNDLRRASAGANAMELLINGIIRAGGERDRLQAKLFGGASMIAGLGNVGARNSAFAREFLVREGISCVSESLGGRAGRRVQFWPATGRARQKLMSADVLPDEELRPVSILPGPAVGNDIELF
ncbi:MAG: chemotaxis protein CheD [Pseudomonadota bacterium]